MIGGFNPGRVSIVSAHTGFGKTNLALNLAIRAAKTMTVGIVNMEMIDTDIMDRLFAIESRKTHDQVAKGDVDWSHMIDFFSNDIPKKMFFTDGKNLSINEIYSYAYRLKKDKNLSILFLDYDQKIDLHLDNRTPEWKALQLAVHAIESMAKELNIHVLMLSQASDEGTPSGSKRSMYPTSVVLWFTKDIKGEKFILRPIKNRFGPTSMSIDLEYKPEMSLIYEKGLYDHNQSAIRPFGGTRENSGRKPSLF